MTNDDHVKAWYGDPKNWLPHGYGSPDTEMLLPEYLDGKDVLDLGCCFPPEKELIHATQARRWVAIDFIPEIIEKCRALPSLPPQLVFFTMDMRYLALRDETFDTVCDFSSGDHLSLDDFRKVIVEAKRVLRPGGVFMVAYSNSDYHDDPNVREVVGSFFGYERRCTAPEMRAYLGEQGFQVVHEWLGNRSAVIAQKPIATT